MAKMEQKVSGITLIFFLFVISCNAISAEIADRLSRETIDTLGFGMSQDGPLKLHKRDLKSQVFSRSKRFRRDAGDAKCQEEKKNFLDALKANKNGFQTNFTFENETKTSLSIVWGADKSGKRVIIVVVAEEFLGMLAKPSSVYFSDDDGGTFENIDDKVKHNDAPAYIKKGNGVQKSPNSQSNIILVGHATIGTSALYITDDGGHNFNFYTAPFLLMDAFVWHPKKEDWLLARSTDTGTLYLSIDLGRTWKQIATNVVKFKWGVSSDDAEETIFLTQDANGEPGQSSPTDIKFYPLMKSTDNGGSWTIIKEKVYTFGSEGKFLYASIQKKGSSRERLMEVSSDGGRTWNEAQLPTITHDRFYSILDMSEEMIFMHVDSPGDSGHGTLYTSDSTGIVFDESLDKHLYPNYQDVTDFYKVKSLRGVYLASQMSADNSIHTVITFNRGAEWQPIRRPSGAPCKDESKPCFLQIHNMYSLSRGIQSQPPLSTPEATGIIMVHGHIADALQTTPPDVYVSSNGGYDFIKSLDGPHHYQIADQGGLLVAVPSTRTPKIIKFSTDEGRCWHEYKFTDKELIFTGLLTEPGNKAMHIGLWGFGVDDRKWRVTIINFKNVISRPCSSGDYETWQAHGEMHHSSDANDKGCLLGVKETFQRLKKDSWCFNGRDWNPSKSTDKCTCTKDDYECDYGYWRPINKLECTRNKNITQEIICLHGKEEKLITQGYRKIPGDQCTGGFKPKADKQQDLLQSCFEGEKFISVSNAKAEAPSKSGGAPGLVAGVVIIVLILVLLMTGFFVRKCYLLRKTNITYKYSMLHQNEEYDYDNDFENALSTSPSLYQDSEEEVLGMTSHREEVDNSSQSQVANGRPKGPRPIANGKPKVQSYHDDSDDDMLE